MSVSNHDCHSNDKYNLWGGRFESGNDQLMKMFNESLPVDKRLWEEDLIVINACMILLVCYKMIKINF